MTSTSSSRLSLPSSSLFSYFSFAYPDPQFFENDLNNILQTFVFFTLIWTILLALPPGSKSTTSAFRLHFIHGLISSIFAIMYIWGKVPDYYPTMASTSYFVVDLCNMILNDFLYKVKSYQQGDNRIIEYMHHSLCGFVLIVLQYDHFAPKICNFQENPGPGMMLAELSTPFLIAWRAYPNVYIAFLFLVMFV